jgi:ABC-type dipeptide/oligopeptide/nickel transport system permease subunit
MKGKKSFTFVLFFFASLVVTNFLILKNSGWMDSQIEKSLCEISFENFFGCDSLGRDLFFRSTVGLFNTFLVGILSLMAAMLIGLIFGFLLAVYRSTLLNSAFEFLNNIPPLILISLVMLYFRLIEISAGLQLAGFILVLSLTHFFIIARAVESKVKEEMSKEYFVAARSIGLSNFQVYKNHVMPNITSHFLVVSATQLTTFFLFESTMSFLGIGLQPPTITMGLIFQDGWRHLSDYPHLLLGPVILFSFMLLIVRGAVLKFKQICSTGLRAV